MLDYLYVSYWQVYGFFIRSSPRIYTAQSTDSHSKKAPVVLIPGIYENWRFMKPIADMLHSKGHPIHVVSSLGYNVGEVEKMAAIVEAYIAGSELKDAIIVAHSKGGLIGKYLLANYPDTHIRGMIALNSPFAGSRYASLIPLKSVRIFLPSSPVLALLASNTLINTKIVSIFGIFDPHIPEGSFLEGAKNIQLKTRGHFKIMRDPKVHQALLKSISFLKTSTEAVESKRQDHIRRP